jgi:hypothetical protein
MDWTFYLDDKWWLWLWHNFSFTMLMIPGIIAAILKIIAMRHPGVPCDGIMELIRVIFTKPGTVTETRTQSTTETLTKSTTEGDLK